MYQNYRTSRESEPLLGTWREISVDDVESLPKAMGMPQEMMDGFNSMRSQIRQTVSKEGDIYTNTWETPGMPTSSETFQMGVEVNTKDIMGNDVKVLNERVDANTYTETRVSPGKYSMKMTRTFSSDGKQMTVIEECGAIKATCVYEKC